MPMLTLWHVRSMGRAACSEKERKACVAHDEYLGWVIAPIWNHALPRTIMPMSVRRCCGSRECCGIMSKVALVPKNDDRMRY